MRNPSPDLTGDQQHPTPILPGLSPEPAFQRGRLAAGPGEALLPIVDKIGTGLNRTQSRGVIMRKLIVAAAVALTLGLGGLHASHANGVAPVPAKANGVHLHAEGANGV